MNPGTTITVPVTAYDLSATLASGQVFDWEQHGSTWSGVVQGRWVELQVVGDAVVARTAAPQREWTWLTHFLQTGVDLSRIIASFPAGDRHLQEAVRTCRGLRLLRQDPWECLASFILSATKQIVQIRQIVRRLSERYGEPVAAGGDGARRFSFPSAEQIALLTEVELRSCKMGFRAPYLLGAARRVAAGNLDLAALGRLPLPEARAALLQLEGVGRKIADCVLLFAYDFPEAFPVDVWVRRVLRQYYFPNRHVDEAGLQRFIHRHFGPHAGYCQQYLFHHIRVVNGKVAGRTTTHAPNRKPR
ncbi:MAG TPA: DNA glycosylase [Verrucomicrobiota bacterium]|nr:DNA glycosylase [Verrucomicrobiota bacterium]HNT14810.1 DNA glycosylase [Verrucomicrobiota bacterium]